MNYINSTGTITPDTSEILKTVEGEWKDVLGNGLRVTSDTPQGMLIAQETQARTNTINNDSEIANQINPNLAGGVFLDSICSWLGLNRKAATYTLVESVTVTGVYKTTIPAGSLVSTSAKDIFKSLGSVTIPAEGTTTVNFQAINPGPVPCAIGTLTHIQTATAVLGWETVNNTLAGVLGTDEQTDASLRQLRLETLGIQGSDNVVSITSALANVQGVSSFSFRENTADITQTIDGISLISHSVWACVQGGTDLDVATALFSKSSGCGWNGSTTVSVVNPVSGQTYTVKFDRPSVIPMAVRVTLSQGSNTSDLLTTAKQAVIDFCTGIIPGEKGWAVGLDASPFDLAGAIVDECPGVRVRKVEISKVAGLSYGTVEIAIALNEQAVLNLNYLTVIIE